MPLRNAMPTLLLDECLCSLEVANSLRKLSGWNIELHSDHFDKGTPDSDVAKVCGQRGWAVVTLDDMRYTPETKEAMAIHNGRVFKVITHKTTHIVEVIASIVTARPKMFELLKKNRTTFCAHIGAGGKVWVASRVEASVGVLTESQERTRRKYGL